MQLLWISWAFQTTPASPDTDWRWFGEGYAVLAPLFQGEQGCSGLVLHQAGQLGALWLELCDPQGF